MKRKSSYFNCMVLATTRSLWTWKNTNERHESQTEPGAEFGLDCSHVPGVVVVEANESRVKE